MFEIALNKDSKTILLPRIQLTGPEGFIRADLILDTGSAYSLISWNVAAGLGYDVSRAKNIPIITGNGAITVPLIEIDCVEAGTIIVRDLMVICHDIPGLDGPQGFLGLNFLKNVRTIIDYRNLFLSID